MNPYRLFLEKLARDMAVTSAVGVTAGMRAALGDEGLSIEARVDAALGEVVAELGRPPPAAVEGSPPPKRGPGRPRRDALPEAQ